MMFTILRLLKNGSTGVAACAYFVFHLAWSGIARRQTAYQEFTPQPPPRGAQESTPLLLENDATSFTGFPSPHAGHFTSLPCPKVLQYCSKRSPHF
jgi:hypothetical protein